MIVISARSGALDTDGFHNALRAVLRGDPPISFWSAKCAIGRRAALTLETRAQCFRTFCACHPRRPLTAWSLSSTVDQRDQIKVQLSSEDSLEAIVARWLPAAMLGGGRIASIEIMVATSLFAACP